MTSIPDTIAVTGRVKTYLENPEKGTMPVSCTVYKYDNDLYSLLEYLSIGLRGAAGIKVILDNFIAQPKRNKQFFFHLDPAHPDYAELTDKQKERWIDLETLALNNNRINVADSMEESVYLEDDDTVHLDLNQSSIHQSWMIMIDLFTLWDDVDSVCINLSNLRPKGTLNKVGLEASGAVSFLSIYEAILNHINEGDILSLMQLGGHINDVLRRGGQFKNGIVTYGLIYTHPEIIKYLNIDLKDLPGSAKKSIRVDTGLLEDKRLKKLVEIRVNDKSLMLEKTVYKVEYYSNGFTTFIKGQVLDLTKYKVLEELFSNVCEEILIKHRGTCLLLHQNLGMIESLQQIPSSFEIGMKILVDLWKKWKNNLGSKASQYLEAEEDRQVGMGVIGLANLLGKFDITYLEHVEAMEAYHDGEDYHHQNAYLLAEMLYTGCSVATEIALKAGLDRAFTMAPTQTCAYNHKDLAGNTTAKNINPPLSKRVRRTSYTVQQLAGWYFHGNVETMQEVVEQHGVGLIQRLWEAWQRMFNDTNLAHSMSFDLYHQIDPIWLEDFLTRSPLLTTYYQVHDKINQSYLNKSIANIATNGSKDSCVIDNPEGCLSCSE